MNYYGCGLGADDGGFWSAIGGIVETGLKAGSDVYGSYVDKDIAHTQADTAALLASYQQGGSGGGGSGGAAGDMMPWIIGGVALVLVVGGGVLLTRR